MKAATPRTRYLRELRKQEREDILHWHAIYEIKKSEAEWCPVNGETRVITLIDKERRSNYVLILYGTGFIWGTCIVFKSIRPYISRWLRGSLLCNMRELAHHIKENNIELTPGSTIEFQHNGTMR